MRRMGEGVCFILFIFKWLFFLFYIILFYVFVEEDSPLANNCANFPLFCMWVAATARLMSGVGPHPATETQLLKQSMLNLTSRLQGQLPRHLF